MASAFSPQASGNEQMVSGCVFFLAAVSQSVLDAMTNGGLGVAFFLTIQQPPLFLPVETDCAFSHFRQPLLQCARAWQF